MSIFIDKNTRLLIQGITGRDGSFHAKQMIEYGTQVVGGITPGKGGQKFEDKVPIFNTVAEAVRKTGANATVIYVPPPFAADAMMEAADAGIPFIVCITEGVPVLDMTRVYPFVKERGSRLLGPNCPGLISPGASKVGIIPGRICTPGPVGLVSRSGTLTYEVVYQMTRAKIGQTTCVGIGGDPINGSSFRDILELFEADPETRAVVLIGEIGGPQEAEAAAYHESSFGKHAAEYGEGIRSLVEIGLTRPAAAYVRADRVRRRFREEAHRVLASYDALLGPTAPALPPRGLTWTGDASLCAPWSTAGFPSISIPTGVAPSGLPHAIQLVAVPERNEILLHVGAWCEGVLGFSAAPAL